MKVQYNGVITVNNQEYLQFTPCDCGDKDVLTIYKQKYLLKLLDQGLTVEDAAKIVKVPVSVAKMYLTMSVMSENRKGSYNYSGKLPKPVYSLNIVTGEKQKHFSVETAAIKIGISDTTIRKAIKSGNVVKKQFKFSNDPF